MKEVTSRLKGLRGERGLTQRDVAIRSKLSLYCYWEIENGYRAPEPEQRDRIARTLKVDPSTIFETSAVGR